MLGTFCDLPSVLKPCQRKQSIILVKSAPAMCFMPRCPGPMHTVGDDQGQGGRGTAWRLTLAMCVDEMRTGFRGEATIKVNGTPTLIAGVQSLWFTHSFSPLISANFSRISPNRLRLERMLCSPCHVDINQLMPENACADKFVFTRENILENESRKNL